MQGLDEAKKSYASLEEKVKAASASKDKASLKLKFFRKASARAKSIGKARVIMEDAVKRAEHILLDKKRVSMAKSESMESRAEMLAEELYHKPGSILSQSELEHIDSETCQETRIAPPNCNEFLTKRSISGVCNNLEHPLQGASNTRFRRLTGSDYADGFSTLFNQAFDDNPFQPPNPSARLVSDTSIEDRPLDDNETTHLIMQWGQFIDHDLNLVSEFENANCDLESCEETEMCAPVKVPSDDQIFGEGTERDGQCHPFVRSIPSCPEEKEIGQGVFPSREHLNQLTHYMDASMVYGSTTDQENFLREGAGGRLLNSSNNNLPIRQPCVEGEEEDPTVPPCCPNEDFVDGCFFAGDIRVQEHVSLTAIHNLFVREHNRVARALGALNGQWDDNRIFLEARRIVIAEVQKISYEEYLPTVFGSVFNELIPPYAGYNSTVDASCPNSFSAAAYRFGHSQIQPEFQRLNLRLRPISQGPLNLVNSFFSPTGFFESAVNGPGTETASFMLGLSVQAARAVDEFLNQVLTGRLFETSGVPGSGMDLATLNIQRGRDHGLPRYGVWKRFCQENTGLVSDFRNELTRIRLMQLYGRTEAADLFVGALAEEPLPGSKIGATLACIFKFTFENIRDGDRFYYENQDIGFGIPQFTPDQLEQIRQSSLSRIICDNTIARSIQRNPFLLSGRRRRCGTGPSRLILGGGIDFQPWREDLICTYRAVVETDETRIIEFFTSTPDADFEEVGVISLASGIHTICMDFVCPVNNFVPQITILDTTANGDCVDANGEEIIQREVTDGQIDSQSNLFRSRSECLNSPDSTPPAFALFCSSPGKNKVSNKQDLEKELANIMQTSDENILTVPKLDKVPTPENRRPTVSNGVPFSYALSHS